MGKKKKFCYERDLSATGLLVGNLGVLPLCGSTVIVDQ